MPEEQQTRRHIFVRWKRAWLLVLPLLAGCVAFSELGEKSTDVSEIEVGMSRTAVEQRLGPCRGAEPDEAGRVRCVYNVRTVDHRPFLRAGTFVADVLTLGLVTGVCGSGFACDMTDEEFARLYLVFGPDQVLESMTLEPEPSR